ncbi:MAG: GTP-binding protein [Gammaproteobacteria bacterium]|nr:GTP-binding protein [Gammaproteobacteria bacterium]
MTGLTSKVCVVGDFAVGKTSVVERFVSNHFSEKYLSTVGVKIDTKEIEHSDREISHKLVIWDVAGSSVFGEKEYAYLRGASGYIYVADGTRPLTLVSAETIRNQILARFSAAPAVLLVNKRDLVSDWEVSDAEFDALAKHYDEAYRTSAKTGDEVETAIVRLAERIVDSELRGA